MDMIKISLQELQAIHKKLDNIGIAMLTNKTVLTFDEVANYTGLSKSYLYKLTSAGLIPHSKPNGKNVYFGKAEIDTWLLRNGRKTNDAIEQEAVNHVTLKKNRG